MAILGDGKVTGVRTAQGEEIPCEGVFLLRDTLAPTQIAPGLELEGNHIQVDRYMATNLPGVFAAGPARPEWLDRPFLGLPRP